VSRLDPEAEIRVTALRTVRGANFWSRNQITRMDLAVGAYDDISSAHVSGFKDRLQRAMPGLIEHRCSIGERGGFLTRLEQGTYAPHIVEHVALELQVMIGHDANYGKTRGGDVPGEYTIVFEHRHPAVGLRAATLALDIVRGAFAGTLDGVGEAVDELRAIAALPNPERENLHVAVAITGGAARGDTRNELMRLGIAPESIVEVAPAQILADGLPFSRCDVAIILDAFLTDVPDRYREHRYARRLVSVLCDAASHGGVVIARIGEHAIHEYASRQGCQLALFSLDGRGVLPDDRVFASASITRGRIDILRATGLPIDSRFAREDAPLIAQVAGALGAAMLVRARVE
jgi:hypothetical protein